MLGFTCRTQRMGCISVTYSNRDTTHSRGHLGTPGRFLDIAGMQDFANAVWSPLLPPDLYDLGLVLVFF